MIEDDGDTFEYDNDNGMRLKIKMGVHADASVIVIMAERDWSLYDLKERVAMAASTQDNIVDTEQVRLITQGRLLDPEEAGIEKLGVQAKFTVIAVISSQKKKPKEEEPEEPEEEPDSPQQPDPPQQLPAAPPEEDEKLEEQWKRYKDDTPLHLVAKAGDLKQVSQILKGDASEALRTQNQEGMTPLMHAAINGQAKLFSKIYERTDRRTRELPAANGMTALHFAAKHGHAPLVKRMLKDAHPGWTDMQDKKGRSALYYALKKKHEDVMKELVKSMSQKGLSGQTFEGWSCLHVAVTRGLQKVCRKLMDTMAPVDLNLQTQQGSTALHLAVSKDKLGIAELLIKRMEPAGLGVQNGKGSTALHLAVFKGRLKVIPKLLPAMSPTSIALRRADGNTALHMAARKGRSDVIKLFIKHIGAPCLASKTNDDSTALHCAAQNGHNEACKLIVQTMDPVVMGFQNKAGFTALSLAAENDRVDTVKMLISANTKIENLSIQTNSGKTALHFATQNGNIKLTGMLGKAMGKDAYSIQDMFGWNSLHNACAAGHEDIVKLILESMPTTYLLMREKEGRTVLHLAAQYGHVAVVRALLAKIDPQALSLQSNNGSTAAHLAAHNGHSDIIGVLAEASSGKTNIFSLQDKYGLTVCQRAAQRGNEPIAKLVASIVGESESSWRNLLPGTDNRSEGLWLRDKFGVELKTGNGWADTEDVAKENDVVGLLFSNASKFGDGEEVTPNIVQAFSQLRGVGKKMDIIFISSDKDEAAFNSYFNTMPWKALPYPDRALQIDLAMAFKLNGFRSALVIIDPKTGILVNKYGREALMRDPIGQYFPWRREAKEFWDVFQGPLIDGDNRAVQCSQLRTGNTFLGVYFTDNESVQSREFTRALTKFYLEARNSEQDYRFDVILAPCMQDESIFADTLNEVPWLSLPLGSNICEELKLMFEIYEEDRLVILNAHSGELVTANGRDGVELDPTRSRFPWPKQAVNFMTQDTFSAVSATPCMIILADGDDVDQNKFHKIFEALHPVGDKVAKTSPPGARFYDLEFLVDNGDSGHTRFLRNIMNLKKKKDFVVIIDTFRMRVYPCPSVKRLKDIKTAVIQEFVDSFKTNTLESYTLKI